MTTIEACHAVKKEASQCTKALCAQDANIAQIAKVIELLRAVIER